ncbi:MAG: peptidyl-prolyl cis-trans isomerase [Kiritimatiellaeota bacterium]|nr:peptidyl-prolyl cis-trans isomerase [Kiritimatiellota bacterium]
MRGKSKHIFFSAATAFVCAFAAFADEPAGVVIDGVAATVNGKSITISEAMAGIMLQIETMSREPGFSELSRDEVQREAFRRNLDELINRQLIIQSYRDGAARISEGMLDKRRAEIIETRYGGDAAKLRAELARDRMTYDDWKKQIEEQMILGSMRQAVVLDNINVSPNEIRREYEARKDEFTRDTMPRVLIHAIKADDAAEASLASFRERFTAGETFEALAKESSVDAMAAKGGDYGEVDLDKTFAPALANAIRGLADDKLSEPMTFGSRVYLILRRKTTKTLTLHEAMERAGAELREKEGRRLYDAWVARLRANAVIKYHLPGME